MSAVETGEASMQFNSEDNRVSDYEEESAPEAFAENIIHTCHQHRLIDQNNQVRIIYFMYYISNGTAVMSGLHLLDGHVSWSVLGYETCPTSG